MRSSSLPLVFAFALGLALGGAAVPAAELQLTERPACAERWPDVAALPGGGLVAVWVGSASPGSVAAPRVFARLFDPRGLPLATSSSLGASPGRWARSSRRR
jgi:hypothetical protein